MLSQAIVSVLHRLVPVVEGEPHDGVKEGKPKVGLVVVEDPFQKGPTRRHPELPIRHSLGKQVLHLLPGVIYGGPVQTDAALGVQRGLSPCTLFEVFLGLGRQGVECRKINAMAIGDQIGCAARVSPFLDGEPFELTLLSRWKQPPPRSPSSPSSLDLF
jgi:hypothetical protein